MTAMQTTKVKITVELELTEENFRALEEFRKTRGFSTIAEAASAVVAESGKASQKMPTWTAAELGAIPPGQKGVLKALYNNGPMTPGEWAKAAGMGYHSLKGHLAQLTLRYKKLKKEALHVWNDATEKYEPNPLYQGMI